MTAFIEGQDIAEIGADRYNSTVNGRTDFPVIADPDGTELNRFWLNYNFADTAQLKVGRQDIVLDNSRFIGNVAWRQNAQTFDAASISASPVEDLIALLRLQLQR